MLWPHVKLPGHSESNYIYDSSANPFLLRHMVGLHFPDSFEVGHGHMVAILSPRNTL